MILRGQSDDESHARDRPTSLIPMDNASKDMREKDLDLVARRMPHQGTMR